jgi:hypothetical protein
VIIIGKNPAFQFYPGDWTRDMDDQDLEIEGAWIRIICRLWWSETRGEATKPLKEWARILRKTEQKTIKIFQILFEKHIASGSILDNQSITIISRRMVNDDKLSQIRRASGSLGGNPTLLKTKKNLDNQNPSKSKPLHLHTSSSTSNNNISEFVLPEWINKELWDAFLEMRKKIKSVPTEKAKELLIEKLLTFKNQGYNINEIMKDSISKNYRGFFEPKGISYGAHKGLSTTPGNDIVDQVNAEIAARKARANGKDNQKT